MSDQNFGKSTPTTNYDPALIAGWGVRPYQWEFSTSVQQELAQRVSLNVGYFRRFFGNFLVTDNRAAGPSDYSPYSIVAPLDPRLPSGGDTSARRRSESRQSRSGRQPGHLISNHGVQMQHWNGIDASINAPQRNHGAGGEHGTNVDGQLRRRVQGGQPSQRFVTGHDVLTQLKLLGVIPCRR
jgi:hypothetical protein